MPFRIPVASSAIIPDGVFGLEYRSNDRKSYRFFALEVDRGTMPVTRTDNRQTSYVGKLAAYQDIIARGLHRSHWGVPNLFVLTITTSLPRLTDIVRKLAAQPGNHPLFLFKAAEDGTLTVPGFDLLAAPWERAALQPLRIDL